MVRCTRVLLSRGICQLRKSSATMMIPDHVVRRNNLSLAVPGLNLENLPQFPGKNMIAVQSCALTWFTSSLADKRIRQKNAILSRDRFDF